MVKRDTGKETGLLFLDILVRAVISSITLAALLNEDAFLKMAKWKEKEPIS